jgi:predicted RNase H-like HicB family nuclease
VVIERDGDGWYVATVPELPGCHTQARSLDTLMERVREAIDACLPDIGAASPRSFLGVQRIAV